MGGYWRPPDQRDQDTAFIVVAVLAVLALVIGGTLIVRWLT